ncbi:Cof-type HAD-IIB family hydrolase [Lapidilactobacillus wuchangensis]|uniref:Cof-type HAD-IIB family hydrolase n=1 Tax=Lapidilactobacillus wuchangensis TaxID=2486001 RepID=UPI000F78AC94|nr:Cof-type HAD-IIB family hydrolase [Lapidilactobacillus wuchangensis]
MIKAIALDIDGTLTNDHKEISPRTKAALMAAQAQGVRLILATGRPAKGTEKYVRELAMDQHHGLVVAFNGSQVIDCQTQQIVYNRAMTVIQSKAILDHAKKFDVIPMVALGDYLYVNDVYHNRLHLATGDRNIIEYEARNDRLQLCEQPDLAAFVSEPINKILLAGQPDYLRANWHSLAAPFAHDLNAMFTADFYFEFTNLGVDKGTALAHLLPKLGLTADELIAFGDDENDLAMLNYAGIGVAMANAKEKIRLAADEVTLTNNDDGIMASLAKHLD